MFSFSDYLCIQKLLRNFLCESELANNLFGFVKSLLHVCIALNRKQKCKSVSQLCEGIIYTLSIFITKSYTGTAGLNLINKHLVKHFVLNTKSSNLFSLFSNVFLAILTKLL